MSRTRKALLAVRAKEKQAATSQFCLYCSGEITPDKIQEGFDLDFSGYCSLWHKETALSGGNEKAVWSNYLNNATGIFEGDEHKTEAALKQELKEQFTFEELEKFSKPRSHGKPSKSDALLFVKRRIAVERLFMRISAYKPQTKRHTYYVCKAGSLSLCGTDTGDLKTEGYFSNTVANIVNDACWDGRIPWTRVLDDSRSLSIPFVSANSEDRLRQASENFAMDLSKGQRTQFIACTEKDAVIESISGLCGRNFAPFTSFHGQSNDRGLYEICEWVYSQKDTGCEEVIVPYAGDFDPGGLDIESVVFDETLDENQEPKGKLHKMLYRFFPDAPKVHAVRVGMTRNDLDEHSEDVIHMNLFTSKGTVDRAKVARVIRFINLLNPSFSTVDFKSMEEEELRGIVENLDVRNLSIDVLSTEEINERFEKVLRAYRDEPEAKALWEEREKEFTREKNKLDGLIKVYANPMNMKEEMDSLYEQKGSILDAGNALEAYEEVCNTLFNNTQNMVLSNSSKVWLDKYYELHPEEQDTTQ